jgi:hypothetical protein
VGFRPPAVPKEGFFYKPAFDMKKIHTSPGPEDMALDASTGTPRLLISCTQRRKGEPAYGGIDAYAFSGDRALPMELDWQGSPILFFPHGIAIAKAGTGHYLYAINHAKEEAANDQVKHSVLLSNTGMKRKPRI